MLEVLAPYLDIEPIELDRLMNLTSIEREHDPVVQHIESTLNINTLHDSLHVVRQVLDDELPPLVADIKAHYNLAEFPLSSYMLGNWVIGFLRYPSELHRLPDIHQNVDWNIIFETIPHILQILDHLPVDIRDDWKKVFSLMAMFVGARA